MADHKVEPVPIPTQEQTPPAAPGGQPPDRPQTSAPQASDPNVTSVRTSLLDAVVVDLAKRISDLERRVENKRIKFERLSTPAHFPPPALPVHPASNPAAVAVASAAAQTAMHSATTVGTAFPKTGTVNTTPQPQPANPAMAAAVAAMAAVNTPSVSGPLPGHFPFLFPHPEHPLAATLMGVVPPPPAPQPAPVPQTSAPAPSDGDRKQSRYWTSEEHQRFLAAVNTCGPRNYTQISEYVGTRNPKQVRTHAQKFQKRLEREEVKRRTYTHRPIDFPGSCVGTAAAAAVAAAANAAMHGNVPGASSNTIPTTGAPPANTPASSSSGKTFSHKEHGEKRPQASSMEGSSSTNDSGKLSSAGRKDDPDTDGELNPAVAAAAAVAAEAAALGGGILQVAIPGIAPGDKVATATAKPTSSVGPSTPAISKSKGVSNALPKVIFKESLQANAPKSSAAAGNSNAISKPQATMATQSASGQPTSPAKASVVSLVRSNSAVQVASRNTAATPVPRVKSEALPQARQVVKTTTPASGRKAEAIDSSTKPALAVPPSSTPTAGVTTTAAVQVSAARSATPATKSAAVISQNAAHRAGSSNACTGDVKILQVTPAAEAKAKPGTAKSLAATKLAGAVSAKVVVGGAKHVVASAKPVVVAAQPALTTNNSSVPGTKPAALAVKTAVIAATPVDTAIKPITTAKTTVVVTKPAVTAKLGVVAAKLGVAPNAAVKPPVQPAVKCVVNPTVKPIVQPSVELVVKPTGTPSATLSAKPSVKLAVKPVIKPTVKPKVQPTVQPAVKVAVTPVVRPVAAAVTSPATIAIAGVSATKVVQKASMHENAVLMTPAVAVNVSKQTVGNDKKHIMAKPSPPGAPAAKAQSAPVRPAESPSGVSNAVNSDHVEMPKVAASANGGDAEQIARVAPNVAVVASKESVITSVNSTASVKLDMKTVASAGTTDAVATGLSTNAASPTASEQAKVVTRNPTVLEPAALNSNKKVVSISRASCFVADTPMTQLVVSSTAQDGASRVEAEASPNDCKLSEKSRGNIPAVASATRQASEAAPVKTNVTVNAQGVVQAQVGTKPATSAIQATSKPSAGVKSAFESKSAERQQELKSDCSGSVADRLPTLKTKLVPNNATSATEGQEAEIAPVNSPKPLGHTVKGATARQLPEEASTRSEATGAQSGKRAAEMQGGGAPKRARPCISADEKGMVMAVATQTAGSTGQVDASSGADARAVCTSDEALLSRNSGS